MDEYSEETTSWGEYSVRWALLLVLLQAAGVIFLTSMIALVTPPAGDDLINLRPALCFSGPVAFVCWAYTFLAPMQNGKQWGWLPNVSDGDAARVTVGYQLIWIALATYCVRTFGIGELRALIWLFAFSVLIASHLHFQGRQMRILWSMLLMEALGLWASDMFLGQPTSYERLTLAFSLVFGLIALRMAQNRERTQAVQGALAKGRQDEKSYLVQRLGHLQEANAAKSRLLAVISHDLRQPVHALGMMLGRLRREAAATTFRVEFDEVNQVVESLSSSLSTLMAVTRLNSGRMDATLVPVVLEDLFDALKSEFHQLAALKGLELVVQSNQLGITTDPEHLRTILTNLLSNAIKYSANGHVQLIAEAVSTQSVTITVRDEGLGIAGPDLSRMFEPFVRLRYHKSAAEGIGLGLSIVKQTAELIDVPIEVASTLGEGTCFSIVFPRYRAHATATRRLPGVLLRGLRVVVVDNDETVLASTAKSLEELGCRVIASNAWVGLEAKLDMTVSPVDLILTDYHLDAGTSGYELILHLRQRYGVAIPAILLTGDVEIRHGHDSNTAGITIAYKPLPHDSLAKLIQATVLTAPALN